MASSRKIGDWNKAVRLFTGLAGKTNEAARKAILQEGHYLRTKMVEGLREQAPAGKAFAPLSPLTLAARRLAGFRGTKALIRRGDLRNGIAVLPRDRAVFIGVPRTARTKDGKGLVDVAAVHEFGSKPFTVRVTARMRRYLWRLYKAAGIEAVPPKIGAMLAIKIPARPFIRPVFDAEVKGMKGRLEARMLRLMKGILAK